MGSLAALVGCWSCPSIRGSSTDRPASFASNPPAYDPHYLFRLAIDGRLSALAAPLGLLEAGADSFAGSVPLILKANNANGLAREQDQAVTATVRDALQLGCAAIGYTIYFGADAQYEQIEEVREAIAEARDHGLVVVVLGLSARWRSVEGRADGARCRLIRRAHGSTDGGTCDQDKGAGHASGAG